MSDKKICFHHNISRGRNTQIRISHICPYCDKAHRSFGFVYKKLPYNEIDAYYIRQKSIMCIYCDRIFYVPGYTDEYKNWLSNES